MNSEQDCINIRQKAIDIFCHDVGAIIGTLLGYAEIFDLLINKEASFANINLPDILHKLRVGEQDSTSKFTSLTEDMKSMLDDCETDISDIIERANTAYQDDFKVWYVHLKQLEIHFLETAELDLKLINLLLLHAENLNSFLQKLRGEVRKD